MSLIYILDLFGTLVFAISGTLAASGKRLDLFGGLFTGLITAVGGGTVRDLLIGATPVGWIGDPNYLYVILAGAILTFLFQERIIGLRKAFFLFDTLGIGVFTIIGLEKAIQYGLSPLMAILMGVITAVMGGVLRDTFVNDIPLILRKEVYATACISGAGLYFLFDWFGFNHSLVVVLTVAIIVAVRIISVRYKLSLPVVHEKMKE